MVHPRVGEDYKKWAESHVTSAYVVKEAALMFESESYKTLDKVIVVQAPEVLRVARVLSRDKGRSESQVYDIIARQMPEEKKIELADYVIQNDERHMVIPQVVRLHEKFINGI
jgi:dephospho-CoA kinase